MLQLYYHIPLAACNFIVVKCRQDGYFQHVLWVAFAISVLTLYIIALIGHQSVIGKSKHNETLKLVNVQSSELYSWS